MYKLILFKNIFEEKTILIPDLPGNWHEAKQLRVIEAKEKNSFWGNVYLIKKQESIFECFKSSNKLYYTNIMIVAIINTVAERRSLNEFEKEVYLTFVKDETLYKLAFPEDSNQFYKDFIVNRISKIEDYGELNVTCKILKETLDFYTFYFKKQKEFELTNILTRLNNLNCNLRILD